MRRLATIFAATCFGLLLPLAASAHEAYAAKDIHLRAGPARDYPVVAILPQGTMLDVQGCLPDYSWCDAIAAGARGWVYAANIESYYQGGPVPLIDYGPYFGIAVFGFILGDYWDLHYRGRPWYRDRDDWLHRPRAPQPPIPPRPRRPGTVPPPVHPAPGPQPPAPRPRPPHPQPPHPLPPVPHPAPPPVRPPATPLPGQPPAHTPPPRSAEPGRPPGRGEPGPQK